MEKSHVSPVAEEAKAVANYAEVNAFDRMIWQDIYKHIREPAVAAAVLEMSSKLDMMSKLYPSLLVRARETLIRTDHQRQRKAACAALLQRLVRFAAGMRRARRSSAKTLVSMRRSRPY